MGWVVVGAWIGAALIAAVVLLFCGYEISWKAKRLCTEGEKLQALGARAQELADQAAGLQERAARAQAGTD